MAREYEVEVLEGLAELAREELTDRGVEVLAVHADGLRVRALEQGPLLRLRLPSAVHLRLAFAVPRPRALLGDENFRALVAGIAEVTEHARFRGFRFAAAGADSSVFRRLAQALAEALGMPFEPDGGELVLRVRRAPEGDGWEVLVRLTPRPSSARPWRVCNRAGGLNATLAAAMVRVAGARAGDRYLNLMCGSGTLLVERALAAPASELTGVDLDPAAVACARANLEAAGVLDACRLVCADALAAPLEPAGYDVIVADLPWGDAVGSHAGNLELYPQVLHAADRLGADGVRVALLTHELRLFRRLLEEQGRWRTRSERRVAHGGHHPHLYLLERR